MALTKARIKELQGLSRKKLRNEQGMFLIEGARLVHDAADSDAPLLEVLHTEDFAASAEGKTLLQKVSARTGRVESITSRELAAVADTVSAQGIVAVVRRKTVSPESLIQSRAPTCVLVGFDAVSDPGNLGSMVRTCDWFGVNGILLGRNSVELYNPKVVRASMGGIFHVSVAEDVDLLSAASHARSLGYTIYVTDPAGETHFDRVRFSNRALIVFGNEAWGVSDQLKQLADERVTIRRYGAAESLNVGVACGIVLSSLHRLLD